jgi:hypothetical protein
MQVNLLQVGINDQQLKESVWGEFENLRHVEKCLGVDSTTNYLEKSFGMNLGNPRSIKTCGS